MYFTAKKSEDAAQLYHSMQQWLEEQEKQHNKTDSSVHSLWVTAPKMIAGPDGTFEVQLG